EAETVYRRSVQIMRRARGEEVLQRIRVHGLDGLATAYRAQGKYAQAETRHRQALALAERTLGRNALDLSILLNNLAVLYKFMGRFAEAARLYRRALVITEKALGPDHPEMATIYHNLGGLEHARGRYARGEP